MDELLLGVDASTPDFWNTFQSVFPSVRRVLARFTVRRARTEAPPEVTIPFGVTLAAVEQARRGIRPPVYTGEI